MLNILKPIYLQNLLVTYLESVSLLSSLIFNWNTHHSYSITHLFGSLFSIHIKSHIFYHKLSIRELLIHTPYTYIHTRLSYKYHHTTPYIILYSAYVIIPNSISQKSPHVTISHLMSLKSLYSYPISHYQLS